MSKGMAQRYRERYTKPGPGIYAPPPDRGFKRFFFLLPNHIRKLILLNLLWILFSIPVVTLPAATTGVSKVLMKLAREGHCFLWEEFWEEFKASFRKSLAIGLPLYLILAGAICLLSFTGDTGSQALLMLKILVGVIAIFFWLVICYFFPMLSMVDLPAIATLKNAMLLPLLSPKQDLLLIALPGGLTVLQVLLLPFSAPLLLFFSLAIAQLGVCLIVNIPIDRHIIQPYTKKYTSIQKDFNLGAKPE